MYDIETTFAETVTGPAGDFPAVFSNEYRQADAGGFVSVVGSAPTLRCQDAHALAKGASVTVRGKAYVVVEVRPDGYGETVHRLQG